MFKANPKLTNRPLAANSLISYRYKGRYDWIMIGALDDEDALHQAGRSIDERPLDRKRLEVWNGRKYVPVRS